MDQASTRSRPVVTNTTIASAWANTTMSDIAVALNNVFTRDGLLGPTGPFKIMDGTVAAPGLAYNSEPSLGWYRKAAGVIANASGGAAVAELDASGATQTVLRLWPRSAGTSFVQIFSDQSGVAGSKILSFGMPAGGAQIVSQIISGGALQPLTILTGTLNLNSNFVTVNPQAGSPAAVTLNRVNATVEAFLQTTVNGLGRWKFLMGDANGETGANAGSNLYLQSFNDAGAYLNTPLQITRSSGALTFGMAVGSNIVFNGSANNHVRLTWGAPVSGQLNLLIDSTSFADNWPISVSGSAGTIKSGGTGSPITFTWADGGGSPNWFWGANNAGDTRVYNSANLVVGRATNASNADALGGTGAAGWLKNDSVSIAGHANNNKFAAYMRHVSDNSVCYLVGTDGTVGTLTATANVALYVQNQGNGYMGGTPISNSDLRLKKDVQPSTRDAVADIKAMEFISFQYLPEAGDDGPHDLGFSAQNLQGINPRLVLVAPNEHATLSPNGNELLATYGKALQAILERLDALEAK